MTTGTATAGSGGPKGLEPGYIVGGRFRVERLASEDSMGVVLAARDEKTKRAIALRMLSSAVVPTDEAHKILREQCRAAALLNHKNIATTYGVGTDPNGGHFVATEWIDGVPLASLIDKRRKSGKPLSLRGAYNIAAHVCRALEYAHATTVHGALRPSVVWVSRSGRVRVSDFGVSRAVVSMAGAAALGAREQACLAPEVRAGAVPNARSDVFGIGALLYEIIAGRPASDGFVPPSVTHPDATPPLDEVLLRCLATDPEARYGTPAELRFALLALVGTDDEEENAGAVFGVDINVEVEMAASVPPAPHSVFPSVSSVAPEAISIAPEAISIAPEAISIAPEAISIAPEPLSIPPGSISVEIPITTSGETPISAETPVPKIAMKPPPNGGSGPRPVLPPRPGPAEGAPRIGQRVSIHEPFRASLAHPPSPAALVAAEPVRNSLPSGEEVDLQGLLARITTNDAARWMVEKNGLDHGPFSGRELVGLVLKGEVLGDHGLLNMDTGERRRVKEFHDFVEFLEQYQVTKRDQEAKTALQRSEKVEKVGIAAKLFIALAVFGVLATGVAIFFVTRQSAEDDGTANSGLEDLYESGDVSEVSVGILPDPARAPGGHRRRPSGGSGGSGATGGGGSGSYEEAMNQAVNLGDVSQGGSSRQLSSAEVQGVMNRHINSMYQCVTQELGRSPGSLTRVSIDVAIAGDGHVMGSSTSAGSPAFQSCIQQKVRAIRFPTFPAPRMGARYGFAVD